MIVRLDGAMGTELQKRGLAAGEIPELWNLTHAPAVEAIHRAYLEAGAEIVTTNTFGANAAKYHGDAPLADVIGAAVACARNAGAKRVAFDVGPTGRLLKPAGDLSFDEAYDAFAEATRLGAKAGADLIAIETFGDTYELKAAILAAREETQLPVFATVALGADGKLLTGADVDTVAALFNALRPDAVGFNCGLGPDRLAPYVRRLAALTKLPIIVKANAGLPRVVDGRTRFDVGAKEFARDVALCIEAGASIVGGCCGTTPEHIRALKERAAGMELAAPSARIIPTIVSSGSRAVTLPLDDSLVIGERINPTGKKKLKAAYANGDTAFILREALAQVEAGAPILDVNAGVPGIDEPKVLRETVEAIQGVTNAPLQIDTADPVALEAALRHYNGRALVNSVNAKEETMAAVFPIVAKYGGVLVALTLDENGIPPTADGRVQLAKKIIARGSDYGLTPDDFVIDVLSLAVSAQPDSVAVILDSLRRIRKELGVRTVLGVSNISFGLPARPLLNASFYTMALEAGLTAAIVNPLSEEMMSAYRAWRALTGRDQACEKWIAAAAEAEGKKAEGEGRKAEGKGEGENKGGVFGAVVRGLKADAVERTRELLAGGQAPLAVIDGEIVPALEEVGRGFESGRLFLPQLLMSADAAAGAFEIIRAALAAAGAATRKKGPIVLATVKGDIHDIGKNIVRALLENYGYEVIDLGRDVPPETVVEAAVAHSAKLVGLSALMTTTLPAMKATIARLQEADPEIRTFVGGAVLTQEYADEIHATWYTKDAMASVRLAEKFFS